MSWDGTLSSGGVQKHGSPQHSTQGNPGTYAMPFAVTFDSAGAETAAYQAWSPTPTYPANTFVLGSNSKLYRAVVSNAGHDPTTDSGTNWVRVSVPTGGSSTGQVPIWDNTAKEYAPGAVAGTLPSGTDTQTLRMNGTTPVFNSFLTNSGNQLVVNTGPSASTGAPLLVGVAGNTTWPDGIEVVDPNATDPTAIAIINSSTNAAIRMGLAGATNQYFAGPGQKDGILYINSDTRLWFGTNALPKMVLDSSGLVIGASSAAGARLDVTSASGAIGAKVTGVAGQNALQVMGSPGGTIASLHVETDGTVAIRAISNSSTGAALRLGVNSAPASTNSLGGVAWTGLVSGTVVTGATVGGRAEETWDATKNGASILINTTPVGQTANRASAKICAEGDVLCNNTGAALATNATGGFFHAPNSAGTPTGVPGNLKNGATPLHYDTTHDTLWAYNGAWITPKRRMVIQTKIAAGTPDSVTMSANTDLITVDTSAGGTCSVTLPDATTRGSAPVWIRCLTGALANVTVIRAGSDTINGLTSGITLSGQGLCLVASGTDWLQLGAKG